MPYSVKKAPFKTLPCFIPEQIASLYGIKTAVFVGRLYALSNGRGSCFYELDEIKKQLKIDRSALTNILKQLKSVGLLSYKLVAWKKGNIGGTHNIYMLNLSHPLLMDSTGQCTKRTEGCAQNVQRGVHVSYDHNTDNSTDNSTECVSADLSAPQKTYSLEEVKHSFLRFLATDKGKSYQHLDSDTVADSIYSYIVNSFNGSITDLDAFVRSAVTGWKGFNKIHSALKPANDRIKRKTNYDLKVAYKA